MSYFYIVFSLLCLSLSINGAPTPCSLEDETCVTHALNHVYNEVIEGIPSYGIKNLNTIHKDKLDVVLPKLNYSMNNGEFTGLKACKIIDAKFTDSASKLMLKLDCPILTFIADYEIHGELLMLKIEGHGPCKIVAENYDLTFNFNIEKKEKDGKKYINLKDFNVTPEVLGKVTYDFKNLYNGNEELSNAFHDAVNKNWKEVLEETHGPTIHAYFDIIINNINGYFENVPIENIFVQ